MADLKQPTHFNILRNPTNGLKQVTTETDGSKERLHVSTQDITVQATVNLGEGNTRYLEFLTNGAATAGAITNEKDQTYNFTDGETLTAKVDGGSEQTATFNTGDFSVITAATAAEVVTVLNTDITGQTASVNGLRVKITSDTTGVGSTIEMTGGTGNFGANQLNFPINVNFGDDGSRELDIDASQAVTTFSISADATLDTFIEKVNLVIDDSSIGYDKFGGGTALTSGIELFYEQAGVRKDIIENAKTNGEIASFLNANNTEIIMDGGSAGDLFTATVLFPQTVHLDAGSSDAIKVRIQDDLSGISIFRIFAEGFTRA